MPIYDVFDSVAAQVSGARTTAHSFPLYMVVEPKLNDEFLHGLSLFLVLGKLKERLIASYGLSWLCAMEAKVVIRS